MIRWVVSRTGSGTETPRARLDHLLPQGYLDGFTDPLVPVQLRVYDIQRQRWFESGMARVAAIKGFHDYSPGSDPDETADESFKEFESAFPRVVRDLVATNFSRWREHLEFLLAKRPDVACKIGAIPRTRIGRSAAIHNGSSKGSVPRSGNRKHGHKV